MKRMLLTRFGKEIEVDGLEINDPPGCYEIQVIEGGLAWSKNQTRQFPMTQSDLEKIFQVVIQKIDQNRLEEAKKKKKFVFSALKNMIL